MAVFTAKEWFELACELTPPVMGIRATLNQNLMLVGDGEHVQVARTRYLETCSELPQCVRHFMTSRGIEELAALFGVRYEPCPDLDTITGILAAGEMEKLDGAQELVCREIARVRSGSIRV